ncbi:Phytol kinase 1, chloroplastic [Gracilariopsis chorda]|uniref:Phytol kinase 1, chloroplastic n=1 Tax=Gracilariopsis chorda TaxID=448386 RepID=A0A2V3J6R4_9FLOR|nr:Phytol kinase 1, chloroplastic [Gracilariopsis chorda]|eukprot:PXF50089.1 Phytol kinase 1, chloroplastic [Gracilariopsis chorda]
MSSMVKAAFVSAAMPPLRAGRIALRTNRRPARLDVRQPRPRTIMHLPLAVNVEDVKLTGAIMGTVVLWLGLWERLTSLKLVPSSTTRKVIHITCGPAFIALWPFYSASLSARLMAAVVPMTFALVLLISGLSAEASPRSALGKALSRSGSPSEALQGPMLYSVSLLGMTLLLFQTPAAVVGVANMCVGDGLAEVVGRTVGGIKWPSSNKSLAGSTAFVGGAVLASLLLLEWFQSFGLTSLPQTNSCVLRVAAVAVVSAAVELIAGDLGADDNVSVALAAGLLGSLLLGEAAVAL